MSDVEAARQRAIAALEEQSRIAAVKARDPFWQDGHFNVQRWVERGYNAAIGVMRGEPPHAGESRGDYLYRMSSIVRGFRERGPDADDEAWYSSAIDDACCIIVGQSK